MPRLINFDSVQGIEWNDKTGGASIHVDSIPTEIGRLSQGDKILIHGKTMRVSSIRKGKVYFRPVEDTNTMNNDKYKKAKLGPVMDWAKAAALAWEQFPDPVVPAEEDDLALSESEPQDPDTAVVDDSDTGEPDASKSSSVDKATSQDKPVNKSVNNENSVQGHGSVGQSIIGNSLQSSHKLNNQPTVTRSGLSGRAFTTAGHAHRLVNDLLDGLGTIWLKAIGGLGKARNWSHSAFQRVTRGWSDDDVWELGFVELRRLSELLERLSVETFGHPSQYERKDWLDQHENDYEEWLQSPARTVEKIMWDADHHVVDLDKAFNETVEEYGVEASAWRQDLHHASMILKEYVNRADTDALYDEINLYGQEESDRRSKIITAEFQKAWEWIGHWILCMWN